MESPKKCSVEGAPELGPVLGPLGSDAFRLNNSIAEILKYSLLRRDANSRTLEIHRLVQTVLKQGMDEATQRLWAELAVRAVNRAFPFVEFSTWAVCERLLPQAQCLRGTYQAMGLRISRGFAIAQPVLAFTCTSVVVMTDAKPLLERALAIREKALGPEHPDVANSLNNLAGLYYNQGQYAKAEPLIERALAIREKALGPEHPDVARASTTWRALRLHQGQYAKAEPLLSPGAGDPGKGPGPGAPRRGDEPQQPGGALRQPRPIRQGRAPLRAGAGDPGKGPGPGASRRGQQPQQPGGALPQPRPIHEGRTSLSSGRWRSGKRRWARSTPTWPRGLNNLALLYDNQGHYAKAEPLYQRAAVIFEKALGPDHRAVANSLKHLADLYRNQAQYAKAEPLYQRALAIREKALGSDHPHLATALKSYALCLRTMDRAQEAEALEARARAPFRRRLPD